MNRISVSAGLALELQQRKGPIELCDPSGRVLGIFNPALDLPYWVPVTPELNEEEALRRLNSNERCYSTAEVLEHLKNL